MAGMRRSGESNAIGGDASDDASGERGNEQRSSSKRSTPTQGFPTYFKLEPPKRRFTAPPPHLSRRMWVRLSRQIAAYLRTRLNNNVTLRSLVRVVAAEMQLSGARPEEIANALRRAVLEHPELTTLDRTNVVTRRLASEELLDLVLGWAREHDRPG
jgi:hypothetical protein